MHDRLLALYHGLPPRARNAAATLRGMYLRMWRYGPDSERLMRAAAERDTWTAEQWSAWREERLGFILERAATRVPYYREMWAARRRTGDLSSWKQLENWPVLEKDVLRENPRRFIADDCDTRRMFHEQTSGTTGKPLEMWRTRRTVEQLYALTDARTERWHGIPNTARWARLGGQLVTPVQQRRPPFWVWNAAMHQLYLSSFHLAPDLLPHYLDAMKQYRITYLAGYSSSLVALAQYVLQTGRKDFKMLAVFTNAEPLHAEQRAVIGEAFQCPVRETYGMTEAVLHASECEAGALHQWPEVGHAELFDGQQPLTDPGATGELVCTGLLNPDMPLIRYRVGDRARLAPAGASCVCGRTLPIIASVEGRSTDMLVTRDGRQIFWLNPVFYGMPVRQSQIIQETLDRITVLLAPAPGYTESMGRTIVERLKNRMGDMAIDLTIVDEVPRTANGKLQAVVCRLPAEQRAAALAGTSAPRPHRGESARAMRELEG